DTSVHRVPEPGGTGVVGAPVLVSTCDPAPVDLAVWPVPGLGGADLPARLAGRLPAAVEHAVGVGHQPQPPVPVGARAARLDRPGPVDAEPELGSADDPAHHVFDETVHRVERAGEANPGVVYEGEPDRAAPGFDRRGDLLHHLTQSGPVATAHVDP